jgi:hypothetical protein
MCCHALDPPTHVSCKRFLMVLKLRIDSMEPGSVGSRSAVYESSGARRMPGGWPRMR